MRQVLDVNILTDEATQKRVGWVSLVPTVLGCAAVGWGMASAGDGAQGPIGTWWAWFLAAVAAYAVSLPLHELVHALFFKALGPAGTKVKFGYQSGMLYAGCPGTKFASAQMLAVLLAPFVLLSVAYWALGQAFDLGWLALALFLLHGAGCAGDLYFAWLLCRRPEADQVEDTETGIRLWSSGE